MNEIKIIKSRRKTISIQVKPDLSVVVRAPYWVTKRTIYSFIEEKKDWIEAALYDMSKKQAARPPKLTDSELKELAKLAKNYIPQRVNYYAELIGVDYKTITIRHQKTRWGSCSTKGGLNFNLLLMKTPPEVIDYVVVHELCHRKEMNHSKRFWSEVEKYIPNYKEYVSWLKKEGSKLL